MKEQIDNIIKWANDRNIIKGSTAKLQFLKLVEETDEVLIATGIELVKEIGDYFVVSIIMLEQLGLLDHDSFENHVLREHIDELGLLAAIAADLSKNRDAKNSILDGVHIIKGYLPCGYTMTDALQAAYDKIKHRKGRMIDGNYVKEQDLTS